MGSGKGHVTYFRNFGAPPSKERLKLEASNLARVLITRGTNKKCKKGVGKGSHVLCLEC